MKSKWAGTTLVNYATIFVDQINSVRPTSVSLLCSVVETIDKRREFNAKLAHTHTCNFCAFSKALRTGEDDSVANIALHLPYIAGMRLLDVHGIKLQMLAVLVVKLIQSGNLPPKWRSRVTPEDEHDGLLIAKRGQTDVRGFVECGKREVGSQVPDV